MAQLEYYRGIALRVQSVPGEYQAADPASSYIFGVGNTPGAALRDAQTVIDVLGPDRAQSYVDARRPKHFQTVQLDMFAVQPELGQ